MMRLPTTSRFLVDLNVNVCKLLPVCYSFSIGFVGKIQLSTGPKIPPEASSLGINRQAMNSTEATLKWSTSVMANILGVQVSSEGWYLDPHFYHGTVQVGGYEIQSKVVGWRDFCCAEKGGTQTLDFCEDFSCWSIIGHPKSCKSEVLV